MAESGGKSFNSIDNKDQLMLVEIKDGKYGGYKLELLNDNLDPLALKFVMCHACSGLSREACGVGEDQKVMCASCVPEGATSIPMMQTREIVPNIPAKCALVNRGCIWKGDIGNVITHLDECEYFVVSCTNSCQKILKRLELAEHLNSDCTHRNVTCKHCNGTVQFKDLTKHHEECPEFPLVCPNDCGGTFKRKEQQGHMTTYCPNTMIACGYKLFGCNVKMKRCELANHNTNNILVHLESMKEHVSSKHMFIEGSLKHMQEGMVGSNQITEINENMKKIQSKLVDPTTIKTLTDSLAKVETEFPALKTEVTTLNTEVTALKTENTTHKTEVTALKTDNATHKTEVTALKTEVTAFKTDNATHKTEVTALKTEVTALKTDNATHKTEVTALKTENTTHKTEVTALKTEVTALKTDNATRKTEVTALKTEVTTHKTEVTALKTEVTALKTENATHKTEVTALKTENATHKTEVTALKTEVTTHKTEVTALKTEVTALKTDNATRKTEVTALKTEVTTLKSNLEAFKKEILAKIPAPAPAT